MIKVFGFFTLFLVQILSLTAYAAKPTYTTGSTEILGRYKAVDSAHTEATVKKNTRGTVTVRFADQDVSVELESGRSGALKFATPELSGECDDPGCSIVRKISGTIFAKKVGTLYQPAMKVTITTEYPFPESEGDLEGLIEETRVLLNTN